MQGSGNVDLREYWNRKIGIRMKDSKRELQDLWLDRKYSRNSSSKSFEVGISLCCWTIEIVITQSWNPRRIFDLKTAVPRLCIIIHGNSWRFNKYWISTAIPLTSFSKLKQKNCLRVLFLLVHLDCLTVQIIVLLCPRAAYASLTAQESGAPSI